MAEDKFEDVNGIDMSNHFSGIVPTIQFIVSTVNLNCELDLETIALRAQNAKYNPKRFAGVIMRISDPKSRAFLFSSGKLICTGAKTEEQAKLTAQKYTEIVQELGFPASFNDFKIKNIVGSCDVQFPINLELLHRFGGGSGLFSRYESKLHPGLVYNYCTVKQNIKMMIFASGKIVISGATVRREIYEAFEDVYPIINRFKKTTITHDLIKSNL